MMKLYIKQCRPYQVSLGGQGFNDNWIPLEDWQDEDNEAALREKYPDELLQKKDAFSILKFQYRYVEYKGIQVKRNFMVNLLLYIVVEEIQ